MEYVAPVAEWLGAGNYWIGQVFAVVLATLVAALLIKVVLDRLMIKAEKTQNLWDDAVLGASRKPLHFLAWLMGLSFAAELAAQVSNTEWLQFIHPVRKIGVILLLTWFLVMLVRRIEQNLMNPRYTQKPMDETTVLAIGKLLRMSVIITAVLVMLQSMGYSISGVLAFGGVGGIAVGFAAKDLLANFFGGLMVYLDRPFSVGDWIRSPDQDIEGTVEEIGWRVTRIRTFDKRPLYVPNSTFTHISLENPSRMTHRRIFETIGVRYDDGAVLADIIAKVKHYLQTHPEIDSEQTLIVNFNKFAASSLEFFIYTFTKTTDWVHYHEVKQEVLLGILEIVESCGAECAFPTTTMHVPEGLSLQYATERESDTRVAEEASTVGQAGRR